MTRHDPGIPTEIGGYRVDTLIGAGGQSEVFAVAGPQPESNLALKWSREQYTPAWSDPLAEEYRTLCALRHPQLVEPHDFGYHADRAFLVIDRINGPTLFDGLPQITLESLWSLLKAVCPVLSFLHHRGIVHRDLKPDNFRWAVPPGGPMSETDGPRLFLLDLGLVSRPRDPATEGRAGTLFYMAPEILKEGKVDARSDLYSLGIILFQWLTGAPPFPGPAPADIIDSHLTAPVCWPETLHVAAGRKVREIIESLLAKDPDDRPANIEEVLAGFVDAGFAAAESFPVLANLPWHRKSTAKAYPQVDFPGELAPGLSPETHITVAGDPGSGMVDLLTRWTHELTVYGWSVESDRSIFRARSPYATENIITVQTTNAPTAIFPFDDSTGVSHYLVLRPQDDNAVARYLDSIFFDRECVETILPTAARLSSGLPEALNIILAVWLESGVISYQDGHWVVDQARLPEAAGGERLRELYGAGLDNLTSGQRRCMGYAAVFGPWVSTALLRRLLEGDGIPPAVVDEFFAHGLFIRETDAGEPLIDGCFRLPGIADVWAADLPPEHRRLLHGKIASVLHDMREEWGVQVNRRLAHHYWVSNQPRKTYEAAITWAEHNVTAEGAEEAQQYLDLAETASRQFEPDPVWGESAARIAFLRGCVFKASGVHESAQPCFRRVFAITRRLGDFRLQAEAAKNLGDTYKATRQHEKGWRILKIALKNFQRLGDEIEVSHTLNNLGNTAYYRQETERALEYYQQALTIQRAHDLKPVMASTLNNIGSVYVQKCDFEQGQHYMKESLRLKETLNQPGEVARTMNNLGFVNVIIGEYEHAVDYLRRAIAINEAIGAGDEWLLSWINLLEAWILQAEYRKVIEKAPQIFRRCDELDDTLYRTYAWVYLARSYHDLGEYRSSQQYIEKADSMMEKMNDSSLIAKFLILQSDRRLLFKDKVGCRRALTAALEQAEKTGDPRERAEVYLAAAKVEKVLGEISPEFFAPGEEAHHLFEKYTGRHRLFELLLIVDDTALNTFRAEFSLPDGFDESPERAYSGPPAQQGLWLWRLAKKAIAEEQTRMARRLLAALATWSTEHETAELYWRAETELGILYHAAHDYEMAAKSFGAALGQLQKIAQTITSNDDRKAYLSGEDVARLNRHMQAFSARFAAKK